ncbi:MAG: histidine phosphatase family protein [Clostridia bacterium]|nr:histidine phosphatase family protein [Clostridia bacterium]
MRILIIRHGDPYYPTDSLTEKGQREAALLGEKLKNEGISEIYVSPHGRAQLTAKPTADALGIHPVVLDWLREFPAMLNFEYKTDFYQHKGPWNMPPELWVDDPDVYSIERWRQSKLLEGSKIAETYDYICGKFDEFTADHGFVRDGGFYRITEKGEGNRDTIALFCHFGLGTAIISHVLNMPLVAVWNSVFLPTSSVTTLFMERHIQSRPIAHGIFCGIGDTSHLYAGGEPISCSGLHTKVLK